MAFPDSDAFVWLRRRVARYSAVIVANSAGGAKYWRRKLGQGARVITIGNAVDINSIRGACFSSGYHAPGAKKRFLVVGRLVTVKALEVVIEAVRLLPRIHAIHISIIGDGPLLGTLNAMISDAGVGDRCSLVPFRKDW